MTTTQIQTRCLFCSLGCPVALEEHPHGLVQPAYVSGNGSFAGGRLCYRGHYVSALMSHPQRLVEPRRVRDGGTAAGGPGVYAETANQIAQAAEEDSLGVLISANLPTSDVLAGAVRLSERLGGTSVSVFMPPGDAALLRGLECEPGEVATLEALQECDVVCTIGDVLGTHPVLGHALMDVLERNPKSGLINIDSARGRTMRFASVALLAQSGREAEACVALAQAIQADLSGLLHKKTSSAKLLECSGLSAEQIDQAAQALAQAKSPVVLVTLPPGRAQAGELIATVASRLAQASKAKLLPLYQYGGSPGSFAVQRRLGLADMGEWLEAARAGRFKTALLLDVDLAAHLPESLFAQVRSGIEQLIVASPMPNETTKQADVVLPLAFWFEMTGQVLDQAGERLELHALRSPPGGALGLVDLLNRIMEQAPSASSRPKTTGLSDLGQPPADGPKTSGERLSLCQPEPEHSYRVMARTETLDVYDGGLSRQLDWPLGMEPLPTALVHPGDAESLQVREKDIVRLSHEGGSVDLCVRVSTAFWPGTVAVAPTIPETRNLFAWQTEDGLVTVQPLPVQLTGQGSMRKGT